jgi:lipopolysaccharide/colanic/teichoic acid biosynthesis glycosyltransferase
LPRIGSASWFAPGSRAFAQVRRGYETSMAEKLAHDLEWIADRSVGLYLRTLFTTGVRVLAQAVRLRG